MGGAADRVHLLLGLQHQQPVEHGGGVGHPALPPFFHAATARRQMPARAGRDLPVAEARDRLVRLLHDVGDGDGVEAGAFDRGAFGLGGIVEIKRHLAVAPDDGNALALENAEVGGVAQVVVLPGIAVQHDRVEAGPLHGLGQLLETPGCDAACRHHRSLYAFTASARRCGRFDIDAIVARGGFRRDQAHGHVVAQHLGIALARIAVAAAAGGEERHAVADVEVDIGALEHRLGALPSARSITAMLMAPSSPPYSPQGGVTVRSKLMLPLQARSTR